MHSYCTQVSKKLTSAGMASESDSEEYVSAQEWCEEVKQLIDLRKWEKLVMEKAKQMEEKEKEFVKKIKCERRSLRWKGSSG